LRGCSLEFESRALDLGTVEAGPPQKAVFHYRNPLQTVVVIQDIKASCDCIRSGSDNTIVGPLEEGELRVDIDTAGKSGRLLLEIWLIVNGRVSGDPLRIVAEMAESRQGGP